VRPLQLKRCKARGQTSSHRGGACRRAAFCSTWAEAVINRLVVLRDIHFASSVIVAGIVFLSDGSQRELELGAPWPRLAVEQCSASISVLGVPSFLGFFSRSARPLYLASEPTWFYGT